MELMKKLIQSLKVQGNLMQPSNILSPRFFQCSLQDYSLSTSLQLFESFILISMLEKEPVWFFILCVFALFIKISLFSKENLCKFKSFSPKKNCDNECPYQEATVTASCNNLLHNCKIKNYITRKWTYRKLASKFSHHDDLSFLHDYLLTL